MYCLGREGGCCAAQLTDETGASETAPGLSGHMDPLPQPAHHDPVFAERLRTGAVQHARVLLHLLVRRSSRTDTAKRHRSVCGNEKPLCFVFNDRRYLSEFLYAWLMSTLSRADSSQMAEERIVEEQLKGRSSKKTKKKKKGTSKQ